MKHLNDYFGIASEQKLSLIHICLALEGVLTSAQERLLVLFGQRMTHALRSEMSRKLSRLPSGTLAEQNPGEVAARFSGDVDTVEALFTSDVYKRQVHMLLLVLALNFVNR